MLKKLSFLAAYKIPLLVSLTLGIALVAIRVAEKPWEILAIFVGTILGTFFIDLEYILIAYVFEPQSEFAINFKAFLKHGDLSNAANYIKTYKKLLKDKSLQSAHFQAILAFVTLTVIYSNAFILIKALSLSVLASTIYKFFEYYFEKETDEWFWILKTKPSRQGVFLFSASIIVVFAFCIYNF